MFFFSKLSASHPVMVYIHGENSGFNAQTECTPGFLLEENIVLVCVQYRLGPFGFLSTQTNEIPGNAGLLDVLLSLKWTQTYIQHFGGDPTSVTLFGHSSGACIVSALTLNPKIRNDLFHRVILQSSSYFSPWSFNFNPVDDAKGIGKLADCKTVDNIDNLNKCLMKMNPLTLLEAYESHSVGIYIYTMYNIKRRNQYLKVLDQFFIIFLFL